MKMCTTQGVGYVVRKAQILTSFDKELLWSEGFLGSENPAVVLDTVVYLVGKGASSVTFPPIQLAIHIFNR